MGGCEGVEEGLGELLRGEEERVDVGEGFLEGTGDLGDRRFIVGRHFIHFFLIFLFLLLKAGRLGNKKS